MENKLILEIHGKPIIVNLKIANHAARRFSYTGGQINMQVGRIYFKNIIKSRIERAIPKSKIDKFNSEEYVGKDYIDITGTRHRLVILEEGQTRERMEDIVLKKRSEVDKYLKQLAIDIYTKRVREYEQIMNIPISHQVKVTTMTAALGKNYHTKQLITLDKTLIHYSIELIDSVVIHELCHYYYQDHSKNFYDLLLKYCPNYKALKDKLSYGIRR